MSHQKTATRFALARVFLVLFLRFLIVLFFDVDINVSGDCQVIRIARTSAIFQRASGGPARWEWDINLRQGDGNEREMAASVTIKKRNCASSVINSVFVNDFALGNAESPRDSPLCVSANLSQAVAVYTKESVIASNIACFIIK